MISEKMQDILNRQIQSELQSAYLYMAMANDCDTKTLKGFAHWLRVQFKEELAHAEKFMKHVIERGGRVVLKQIDAPASDYGNIVQLFERVLEHERGVTKFVHGLHEEALAEKDVATQVFLQWFITEQVEEEASVSEIVDKLKMVGDRGGAVLYLDKEMGKRQPAA